MTDNIQLNAGSGGDVVASDDVGGVHYQIIKVACGPLDAAQIGATPMSDRAEASSDQDSTVVKASAGVVYSIAVSNTNSAARYIKLYNKATGPVAADTPIFRFAIPGSGGIALNFANGIQFTTGIGFRLTTGNTDADAVAVAAGELLTNIGYV